MSDDKRPGRLRPPAADGLRVGVVPGVTVTKWTRIWAERLPRHPLEVVDLAETDARLALDEDRVDVCFVRLPVAEGNLHLIPMYREVQVVIVNKEHPLSLFEEVRLADLSDEKVLDGADIAGAVDRVAGGAGVLLAPFSIARTLSRRDLVYRTVVDAEPTEIALGWRMDHPNELIEDFVGIVRGRTPNSSRSPRRDTEADTRAEDRQKGLSAAGRSGKRSNPGRRPRSRHRR